MSLGLLVQLDTAVSSAANTMWGGAAVCCVLACSTAGCPALWQATASRSSSAAAMLPCMLQHFCKRILLHSQHLIGGDCSALQ